ncbi:hypothetical protein BSY239_2143 [Hydrogenophaga sp. RAC07]|nr:hypothetical protein BSY239_2143 [Hydrogenophaga sp. RAC07]
MRIMDGLIILTSMLWVATVLCAVSPSHADSLAAPVSVIEVITAEVPANLLAEEEHPDHDSTAQAHPSSNEAPHTEEKSELGSAIFNPFSQAARQRSGASSQGPPSDFGARFAWEAVTLVAVLAGVVAVVLLARTQEPGSDS